ncbi:MAG: hypothetical protein WC749_09855 [Dehalococcoidia bacterium]
MSLFKSEEVKDILERFNNSLPEGKRRNLDEVIADLVGIGGGVESVAREVAFEDVARLGIPMPVARAITKIWRVLDTVPAVPVDAPAAKSEMRVGGFEGAVMDFALALGNVAVLGDEVLIRNYHPLERDYIVRELDLRAGGKPFIAYDAPETFRVNVEVTLNLLQLIKQGVEVPAYTSIGDKTVELYRAGVVPDRSLEICPIHGCHLINGYCGECHQSWNGIGVFLRELAYLQVKEVWEGKVPTHDDPRIPMLFAATKGEQKDRDAYWSDAKMFHDKYKATGQVIILVKPLTKTPSMRRPTPPANGNGNRGR